MPVLFGGYNLTPLVEIGLTDLPKSGGAMAPVPGTPRDNTPAQKRAVGLSENLGGSNFFFLIFLSTKSDW